MGKQITAMKKLDLVTIFVYQSLGLFDWSFCDEKYILSQQTWTSQMESYLADGNNIDCHNVAFFGVLLLSTRCGILYSDNMWCYVQEVPCGDL